MLISPAFAQTAADVAQTTASPLAGMLPLVLIFVIFYFLLIRPQQKKFKEHQKMVDNLRRGDKVVTGGGIIGVVTRLESDDSVQVEIAQGVKVKVIRGTITNVLSKSAPADAANDTAVADERMTANDN